MTTNITALLRFSHHQCIVQHFERIACIAIVLVYNLVPNIPVAAETHAWVHITFVYRCRSKHEMALPIKPHTHDLERLWATASSTKYNIADKNRK